PARADVGERAQIGALDHAAPGDEEHELILGKILRHQHLGQLLALGELNEVDDRLSAGGAAGGGNLVNLEPIEPASGGDWHQVGVGRGDEDVADEIVFLGGGSGLSPAAAALRAVF